ncbi:hypothetical protein [Nocardia sp. alder85J]|nr:hypothetical protein [Nocardia sp. alder85J]MCX4092946.1 hypothetical protein [Nocardia sp. alder85J]
MDDIASARDLGLTDAHLRNPGPRMWWGSPFLPTRLVSATAR